MISQAEYHERRQKLMQSMGKGSIAFIPAAKELFRNSETEYNYRQDSAFLYYTGFEEPNAMLVFAPGRPEGEFLVFNQKQNPAMAVWIGEFLGQQGAIDTLGADQAFPIEEFPNMLADLLQPAERIYLRFGRDRSLWSQVEDTLLALRKKIRAGIPVPTDIADLAPLTYEQRMIKSDAEIEIMRKAAQISAAAHIRGMKAVAPDMYEYQIEAELMYGFISKGSRTPAYGNIVAGGNNSCVLHYVNNDKQLKDGDILLVDAGGEHLNYASDITRTYPVNGKYSEEQKAIYNLVLKAELAVIDAMKPGLHRDEMQTISEEILTEGLLELGILQGDLKTCLKEKSFKRFYPHYIGHWIGLDVHDVGAYKLSDGWRKLQAGMVHTVEPGIYISEGSEGVDPKWWGIGVRIEDDVLVTKTGTDVLSRDVPKTIEEIEAIMAQNAD